jgi:hypothetical protein
MVDDRPDAERFEDTINPILDKAAGTRKRLVRIYGEIVDVLWSSGRENAALSLEILWHQLVARRKCALLCGYSSGVAKARGSTPFVIGTATSCRRRLSPCEGAV